MKWFSAEVRSLALVQIAQTNDGAEKAQTKNQLKTKFASCKRWSTFLFLEKATTSLTSPLNTTGAAYGNAMEMLWNAIVCHLHFKFVFVTTSNFATKIQSSEKKRSGLISQGCQPAQSVLKNGLQDDKLEGKSGCALFIQPHWTFENKTAF